MKRILFVGFILSSFFVSCKHKMLETIEAKKTEMVTIASKTANPLLEKLKMTFARALAISLFQSQQLRETIKNKALEMFNKDTEVLYFMIRDLALTNGQTVENLVISNYELGTESDYTKLMQMMPTLTVLVPELPEESFSAKTWSLQDTLAVGVRQDNRNEVPLYHFDGSSEELEAGIVPNFPVLVVKQNERVITNQDLAFAGVSTRMFFEARGVQFKFTHDGFDGSISERIAYTLDQKVIDAFNIYNQNPQLNGWHRDYIYYDITPTAPNGPFKYDFMEHIKSFELQGAGTAAYAKIADQTGDPTTTGFMSSHWTGGTFEFLFKVLINATDGTGKEIQVGRSFSANQLFDLHYSLVHIRTTWWGRKIYGWRLSTITTKKVNTHIPLINWNLDVHSVSIKISAEEIDIPTATTVTTNSSAKFATNFGFDISFGEKVKKGLKFGISSEVTNTSQIVYSYTQGNDFLGDVIVNFADKVIIRHVVPSRGLPFYETREYNSGWYAISVEPIKVQ